LEHKSIKNTEDNTITRENAPETGTGRHIAWISKDYEEFNRGKFWKLGMIIIVIALVIVGIFMNSWTFSLAIIVFSIVYWMVHKSAPGDLPVELSEIGVKIGKKQFLYAQISAFSLDISSESPKIIFYLKNDLLGERKLQLFQVNPALIQAFLKNKIPEIEKKNDTFGEMINKFLKI
jgi:hypothetical protein